MSGHGKNHDLNNYPKNEKMFQDYFDGLQN